MTTVTAFTPYTMERTPVEVQPGDRIRVTWFGGNGPHEYIAVEHNGEIYAALQWEIDAKRLDYQSRITGKYAEMVQAIEVVGRVT